MDEQHVNKEFSNGAEPPVPIPSVDQAWGGMEKLLNKELPLTHVKQGINYSSWLTVGSVATVVIVVVTLITVSLTNNKSIHKTRTPIASTAQNNDDQQLISSSAIQKTPSVHPSPSSEADAKPETDVISLADHQSSSETKQQQNTSINKSVFTNDSSSINQPSSLITYQKGRKAGYKNKQLPAAAAESGHQSSSDAKQQRATFTPEAKEQRTASTPETIQQKPASIEMSMLPLHKENRKELMHHDMQVTPRSYSTKEKANPSDRWSVWLQLNVPLPLNGTKYYTTGPKGNDAVYRNFIPSLRLERAIGKSALSIDLHPYNTAILPVKKGLSTGDTTLTITRKQIVKQFGPEALLLYHYPVYKNLQLSAGLGASFWRKAISVDSVSNITAGADWKHYPRIAFTADIEVYYDLRQWQMGLRTALPLNKYTREPALFANKRLQVELLLRRRISWPSFFSLHN